jgi:hypothetical protein
MTNEVEQIESVRQHPNIRSLKGTHACEIPGVRMDTNSPALWHSLTKFFSGANNASIRVKVGVDVSREGRS